MVSTDTTSDISAGGGTRLVWKRAATLVVGIEFLTAVIGLLNKVAQLAKIDDTPPTTDHNVTTHAAEVAHSMMICFVIVYVVMMPFDLLLYIGIRTSRTIFLRIWHRFSIFMIVILIIASMIEAYATPAVSDAPPQLIIRIFETWILDEYLKSIADGFVYQRQTDIYI